MHGVWILAMASMIPLRSRAETTGDGTISFMHARDCFRIPQACGLTRLALFDTRHRYPV
jgi:hypothetical protein